MRRLWFTPVYVAEGGCAHCGRVREPHVFATFIHDVGCWGWRTAWHNVWHRDA